MKTSIEFNDETIDVEVEFNYYPGDPGLYSYSNGDPGYPPTGPEVEIISISDGTAEYIDIIDAKQLDRIQEEIINQEPAEPDFDI